MAKTAYSAESIQVLTGLEPVRKRPGMYTDTARPNHLVQEVVDNSVDEALAGHARRIEVVLEKGGAVAVRDDGRGMPVDVHPEHGVSGVELILTRLHAGGKFSDENYRFSGGLHGVGVSVVNALASWLEVEVLRDGQRWRQRFEGGVPFASSVKRISRPGHSTALARSKWVSRPREILAESKKLASGEKRTVVPERRRGASSTASRAPWGTPPSKR